MDLVSEEYLIHLARSSPHVIERIISYVESPLQKLHFLALFSDKIIEENLTSTFALVMLESRNDMYQRMHVLQ